MPLTYFSNSKYNKMSECFNHLIDKKNNVFSKDKIDYVLATSLFFYNSDSGYSNITKELKYFGNIPSGRFFSKILGTSLRLSPYFNNVSVIIPVPLHWKRRLKRGYNQAEIISSELALTLSASMYNDILYRSRSTKTQTGIEMNAKYENVKDAFSVNYEKLKKCISEVSSYNNEIHILIVDDVFTSGSTMFSCYKPLKIALDKISPKVSYRISIATLGFVSTCL